MFRADKCNCHGLDVSVMSVSLRGNLDLNALRNLPTRTCMLPSAHVRHKDWCRPILFPRRRICTQGCKRDASRYILPLSSRAEFLSPSWDARMPKCYFMRGRYRLVFLDSVKEHCGTALILLWYRTKVSWPAESLHGSHCMIVADPSRPQRFGE